MTTPSTNYERVDALTHISDQVYPILEERVDGEARARRIVRLGIASIAIALNEGETLSQAGGRFDRYLAHELRHVDYGAYEPFRTPAEKLSDLTPPDDISKLADSYSDTLRGTCLSDHSRESDAIHALHLNALAVPYARAHYPLLDTGKVAAYDLLHDLPEAYAGDAETFNISPEGIEQKKRDDAQAIADLMRDFGSKWPGLMQAVSDYEDLVDSETAFTKTKDKNDPGYTHFRNGAYALKTRHHVKSVEEFYERANINTLRTLGYASRFALVLEDKIVLNERIAALIEQ